MLPVIYIINVADPHYFDPDPDPASYSDADPEPACHFDTDSDPACHFDADPVPDPVCRFDADRDPDPTFTMMRIRIRILESKRLETLKKCSNIGMSSAPRCGSGSNLSL